MAALFNKDSVPRHLFDIPEIDLSGDLLSERLSGPWFRLGSNTIGNYRNNLGIEDIAVRHSLLIGKGRFKKIFRKLDYIGNVLHDIGKPQGTIFGDGKNAKYRYIPFYTFKFAENGVSGEPLVFYCEDKSQLFINPDILLFFELEEKQDESGVIWWDPKLGVEAMRHITINQGSLEIVEITAKHLLVYIKARQMSLLVCHYHHLKFLDPLQREVDKFEQGEVLLGSAKQGAKAIIQNAIEPDQEQYLLRRLHLWFEIKPPKIDIKDPWREEPTFDIYKFTLPTSNGPMAPGVKADFKYKKGRKFAGSSFVFLTNVYFRQEVLAKYEIDSNYTIDDNGSVHCLSYWGLDRSTKRHGNELISTFIGDFAEGVPFEEWMHWKQYAVEPPSRQVIESISHEQKIPDAVNNLIDALQKLNDNFKLLAKKLGANDLDILWNGSLNSMAGRQLKWIYPNNASDDELLKRATLASTLILDELSVSLLRELLGKIGNNLDKNLDNYESLGSRNLLQRLKLVLVIIKKIRPSLSEIPKLVKMPEFKEFQDKESELKNEVISIFNNVRKEFSPLAFLYDLRLSGGLAHPPNAKKASEAAEKLGLPKKNWNRSHYLNILEQITICINKISCDINIAIPYIDI